MIDTFLTICGVLIFAPWIIKTSSASWNANSWHRQLLIACLSLETVTLLYIPSIMYIGLGVLILAFGIYLFVERPKLHITTMFIMALAYLLWYTISLSWSPAPRKGLHFLLDNGLVLVTISSISCFISIKKEEYTTILQQFCYASCIFVAMSILSWLISSLELQLSLLKWPILKKELVHSHYAYSWIFRFMGGTDGYIHPSYNLLPVFMSTPIAAWLKKNDKMSHFIWVFLWIGSVILTLLSQSRMGIIYASVVFVGNIAYLLSSQKLKSIIRIGLCACMLVAFGFSKNFLQTYGVDRTRDTLEDYTLRYIQAKPFRGAGAGALNPIEICRTIKVAYWPNIGRVDTSMNVADWKPKTKMLPHNQWLADWAHAGVIAALITTLLYLCVVLRAIKLKNYWGVMFILIFSIFSMLEPPMYISKGFYLFCILTCLIFAESNTKTRNGTIKD